MALRGTKSAHAPAVPAAPTAPGGAGAPVARPVPASPTAPPAPPAAPAVPKVHVTLSEVDLRIQALSSLLDAHAERVIPMVREIVIELQDVDEGRRALFMLAIGCPKDSGELVVRKMRKGRVFYGCANYPACDFTSWKLPLPRPCPNCGGLLVQADKRNASCTQCEEQFSLEEVATEDASGQA